MGHAHPHVLLIFVVECAAVAAGAHASCKLATALRNERQACFPQQAVYTFLRAIVDAFEQLGPMHCMFSSDLLSSAAVPGFG